MATTIFSLVGKIALDGMKRVNADIKEAEKQTKDLQKAMGMLGQHLTKVGGALSKNLTAPLAGVGVAIGALALKTGAYASELLSMKEATGLSMDAIQEYEQVARAAGVSGDAFLKNVSKLSTSLEDISKGSGPAAVAMDRLGISVTNSDGSLRSMDDLLPEIIGKLNGVEDVNQRNGIAADIFGKKLKDVAPILSMTSTELDAVRKSAHDTGKVMGEDALKNADQFRLSIDNLKKDFSMLGMQIGNAFIPILQDQVMPLIQDTVIPLVKGASDKIKELAEWFGNLNPTIQKSVIVFGVAVAAMGPMLLIIGKMILSIKALIPVVQAVIVVFKAWFAAIVANPIGLIATAIGLVLVALGALMLKTRQLNEETRKFNEETERMSNRTTELNKQTKAAKKLVEEYKKLEGTADFDPAELKRLTTAHEDAVIALKNHAREMNNKEPLDEREIENTRRRLQGLKELNGEMGKSTNAMTDLERARLEKEKDERNKAYAERKKELASLVQSHKDATDGIMMTEMELLDKEEQLTLQEAKRLGANEAEMQVIRDKYIIQREDRLYKFAESHKDANAKIGKSELELLAMEEQAALKEADLLRATEMEKDTVREHYQKKRLEIENETQKKVSEINAQWENKLIQQSGSRIAIMEAEKNAAIKEAEKSGADTLQIERYYANEKIKVKKEADAQWRGRLAQQQGNQLSMLEAERANEIALAAETGADVYRIEEYYAKERAKLQRGVAESWVGNISGAVNQIGSIMAGFAANEEKRLSKEHKDRKAYIEANVDDEADKASQLAALDEEIEGRKLEIQRESARREKKLGVFNTIINTATAIVKALAEMGPIAGPIMAGVIGALGAAQLAVITSEPEPFAMGATIKGGRGGVNSQVGEGRQDELILPMETGTQQIVDAVVDRLQSQAAAPTVVENHYHWNLSGVITADDKSLKELARRMTNITATENRRVGRA